MRLGRNLVFIFCLRNLIFHGIEAYSSQEFKEKEHELIDIPDFFYHATGALVLFEIGKNGGAPRGPAFFSTVPTNNHYIDLYHHKEDELIRREIKYKLTTKPMVAKLRSFLEEKKWVEDKLQERLPEIFSGRGSIIDRYPEPYKIRIKELYQSFGYDALFDKKNNTIVFFDPEKFIRTDSVKILDRTLTKNRKKSMPEHLLLCGNHVSYDYQDVDNLKGLKLYHLLIYFWCKIKLEDLDPKCLESIKIIANTYKLGYDIFYTGLFPLASKVKLTQKKEDIIDFMNEEDFFWIIDVYSHLNSVITSLIE
jgi:hypothetical protein